MNNITITMELCTEDRERLDNVIKALQAIAAGQAPSVEPKKAPAQANTPAQPKQPTQAATAPQVEQDVAPWDEEPPTQTEPTVTMEDIQHLIVTLATTQGKKAEAREIVRDYADRVTEIPADKWDVVYRRLKKLEG